MAIPHPILNTRAPQPLHDRLALLSRRRGTKAGTLHRELLEQALVMEEATELLRTVGFQEVICRLTRPSYPSHAAESTTGPDRALVQTG